MTRQNLPLIEFALPWMPTHDPLHIELAKEVGNDHPLAKRRAIAIGRRTDNDDVLFYLPDGPAALAVVHLTWSGRRERNPTWPFTELYDSAEEFVARRMNPDRWSTTDSDASPLQQSDEES